MSTDTIEKQKLVIDPFDFTDLNLIYPEESIESEMYRIDSISLDHSQVRMEHIRNHREPWMTRGLQPDFKYKRLVKVSGDGELGTGVMMSDMPMERNTNIDFICNANGDVLIFGLGLGLIVLPLLANDRVKSVTVVELYSDLISLVEPYLKPHDQHNKLTVVRGDARTYKPDPDKKYDTIYFDIWMEIVSDHYEEQKTFCRVFRKHLNKANPDAFIDCWMKSHYQNQKRRGQS